MHDSITLTITLDIPHKDLGIHERGNTHFGCLKILAHGDKACEEAGNPGRQSL
jgi:hypothetical protein